jgi:riboflavin kinase/FMN adenylyltransferase
MKIFHGTENAEILRPTVVTLGVFDGLHLGHQQIMKTVVSRARATSAVATAITFDPHPRAVLQPNNAPPLLQTLDQRLGAFEVLGIEQAIIIRFSPEFAATNAAEFLRRIIFERLKACEVYLGKGFAFGKGRAGNIDLLRRLSREAGVFADEVPEVVLRGQRISSSRIRQLLLEGRINLARRMLGRPYGIEGEVVKGFERGRTIGFPTANLQTVNRVIPRRGVYVTATLIEGAWRRSISNIGVRPTFADNLVPSVETFVIDWKGDLYNDVIRVRFLHRIRDERKFAGIDELKTQIQADLTRARRYFECKGVHNSLNIV